VTAKRTESSSGIRHLATFAEAERRRWDRSQRRQPHNRTFKRRRASGKIVREPVDAARMIFAPFYELIPAEPTSSYPPDARLTQPTELAAKFFADYRSARFPKRRGGRRAAENSARGHRPMLEQIEVWNLRR
jgi:hypothetical protein